MHDNVIQRPIDIRRPIGRRSVMVGVAAAGALGVVGAGAASPAKAAVYPTLQRGSQGSGVVMLQQNLAAAGFWLGAIDGDFGHLTQQAVWAAQKFYGLVRDGVVGPITWGKVLTMQRPTARYAPGYRIEIDTTRELLLVVWGNDVRFTLNTSTGDGSRFYAWGRWYVANTPSGFYKVYSYYRYGWQTGALGAMWRPYYFNGGIAIHGSTSIPPWPASHGCCRVSTAAQDMLIASGYLYPGRLVYVY